ncbi:MAG: metallophosphoesterase family protein [Cyanobium sp.]
MTHAVISCLHANLAALEAVLADIDQQGIATITCLGDLVGYGPQPNEVVNLVRQRAIPTCQGCWDEDIIEGLNACDCSYPSQLAERRGHQAHQWTAEQLSEENKAFLASLPMSLRRDRLLFVHGSPNSQHEYLLPDMDAFAALERVQTADADTLFCGHTHRPYVRELRDGVIRPLGVLKAMAQPPGEDRRQPCVDDGAAGALHVVGHLADRDGAGGLVVNHIGGVGVAMARLPHRAGIDDAAHGQGHLPLGW